MFSSLFDRYSLKRWAKMRTQRTSRWLLASVLFLLFVFPAFRGQAAGDGPLVTSAKEMMCRRFAR